MTTKLPPHQDELWQQYSDAEKQGARTVYVPALYSFLDSLDEVPPETWHDWACDLSRSVVDKSNRFQIRVPLFERALFPALLTGLQQKKPGCARWMAGLLHHVSLRSDLRKLLDPIAESPIDLLKLALRQDPDDSLARNQLIDRLLDWFDYAFHEIPSGVLGVSHISATAEQCKDGLEDVALVRELLHLEGRNKEYGELLQDCEFHYRRYQDYLGKIDRFPCGYPDYLQWCSEGGI